MGTYPRTSIKPYPRLPAKPPLLKAGTHNAQCSKPQQRVIGRSENANRISSIYLRRRRNSKHFVDFTGASFIETLTTAKSQQKICPIKKLLAPPNVSNASRNCAIAAEDIDTPWGMSPHPRKPYINANTNRKKPPKSWICSRLTDPFNVITFAVAEFCKKLQMRLGGSC